ncbi:hypothetical protein HY641_02155 [Candidatus Woesearchaeota archaeon]|nr:hypothetical protein [Candidatus Woesearchaeota archaeon]
MNWRIFVLIGIIGSMLLVSGCAKSNALTGNGSADVEEITEDSEDVSDESEDESADGEVIDITEPVKTEELANVTDAPVYEEFSNTCSEDSKGVVRTFDAEGNKQVHRNTCLSGILTDFKCVENEVASDNRRCPKGCTTTPYGAMCKE